METNTQQTLAEPMIAMVVGSGPCLASGIWTVATLGIHDGRDVDTRTWGYHFTRDEAVAAMYRFCDTEAGYYTHAVIENFAPGIYALPDAEEWFVWDDGWKPCAKPESESGIVSYGMG